MFPGTFAPWNESFQELSFQGTKCSQWELLLRGAKSPWTMHNCNEVRKNSKPNPHHNSNPIPNHNPISNPNYMLLRYVNYKRTTTPLLVAIISLAAGLCTKSIISPGRTDTEIYFQADNRFCAQSGRRTDNRIMYQSGRTENRFLYQSGGRYFPSGSDGATYRIWLRLPVSKTNPEP